MIKRTLLAVVFFLAQGINQTFVEIQNKFYEEKGTHIEVSGFHEKGITYMRIM